LDRVPYGEDFLVRIAERWTAAHLRQCMVDPRGDGSLRGLRRERDCTVLLILQ
jgi:hypothetical protein